MAMFNRFFSHYCTPRYVHLTVLPCPQHPHTESAPNQQGQCWNGSIASIPMFQSVVSTLQNMTGTWDSDSGPYFQLTGKQRNAPRHQPASQVNSLWVSPPLGAKVSHRGAAKTFAGCLRGLHGCSRVEFIVVTIVNF